jgi:hypothetical protein
MEMNLFWFIGLFLAGIYCVAQGIQDVRQKRYLWGALGILSAIPIWLAPIPSHAIKIDLPVSSPKN